MSTFWDAFSPDFTRNSQLPFSSEFNRLATQRGWVVGSNRYRKEWSRCCGEEFTRQYGQDAHRLSGWQGLCADVGIKDIPSSITQCKKVLNTTWVNIVDLVECRESGRLPAKQYRSQNALREYTQRTGKIFPKKAAKRNKFLAALLIVIF
ncbi:hypothetical protein BOTBODRAFT_31668 [Botryobasidium botryosum FD-172 SS1]|uniref:Uncharacterized protein n=1 Tax=Botryobasidium botryosum (strain FD-172 SS1) TaxID=930990 RepID=A0A067MUY4_BOTB1|nr:hypothetical protein BOTBODRAFT_31668 [Botryobasidium botryosum FD-172 SS1]